MSTQKEEKKMKPNMETCQIFTWQDKKEVADEEGQALEKEVEELLKWTNMIEDMNDQQLKDYVNQRPDSLKTVKMENSGNNKRVQRVRKSKRSIIMSAVWKFHREDSEESSVESNI